MASFTPLNRRPTKSLNKDKMRRFLAKRKWKVTEQKNDYNAVSRTFNACIIYNLCFCMMTFLNLLSFVDLKLGYECSLSFSVICPLNLQKTGKAVLALQRMANLSNRPDSPGSSSEGKTDKVTHKHTHICNALLRPRATYIWQMTHSFRLSLLVYPFVISKALFSFYSPSSSFSLSSRARLEPRGRGGNPVAG